MFSAFPAVADALFEAFTDACTSIPVRVYDGPAVDDDVIDFVMVGVEDPWSDAHGSGDGTNAWATFAASGTPGSNNIEERVSIPCLAHRKNGDADMRQARADLYRVLEACWDSIRTNPTLGVTGVVDVQFSAHRPVQAQTDYGAEVMAVFTVTYTAYLEAD